MIFYSYNFIRNPHKLQKPKLTGFTMNCYNIIFKIKWIHCELLQYYFQNHVDSLWTATILFWGNYQIHYELLQYYFQHLPDCVWTAIVPVSKLTGFTVNCYSLFLQFMWITCELIQFGFQNHVDSLWTDRVWKPKTTRFTMNW